MKILKRIITPHIVAALFVAVTFAASLSTVPSVRAATGGTSIDDICRNVTGGDRPSICQNKTVDCSNAQAKTSNAECQNDNPIVVTILKTVQVINYAIGAAAVIAIIIGGLRYTLSRGDSNQVAEAKDSILYAIVGVVVAIASQAIVVFILNRIL